MLCTVRPCAQRHVGYGSQDATTLVPAQTELGREHVMPIVSPIPVEETQYRRLVPPADEASVSSQPRLEEGSHAGLWVVLALAGMLVLASVRHPGSSAGWHSRLPGKAQGPASTHEEVYADDYHLHTPR